MNILIIEDETAAARQLQQLIKEIIPSGIIVAIIESVREAVSWFGNNNHPDLIITDIQLADGTCFEIFSQVTIQAPVIFTTAYDAFMQQAFKTNSIDYLLKPIDRRELQTALFKYQEIQNRTDHLIQEKVLSLLSRNLLHPKSYKTRFLVKNGDRYFTIPASEIAYLRAEDRIVFLHNNQGQKYIIDESLDELEKQLDPATFYRLNRQYMAPIDSIEKIQNHFNGRLWIQLKHSADKEVFISREKAGSFKLWLDGK